MASPPDHSSYLAEYREAEDRRDRIARGAFQKPYAACDFNERRDVDGMLTPRQRHVIVLEEARRKALAAAHPGAFPPTAGGGVAPPDDQERRVVALVNAPEAIGRRMLAQRLADERAIPLERAAAYLAKGPLDPDPDQRARRIANGGVGAQIDEIEEYVDQVIVAERAIASERVRAIVESQEGRDRPTFASYLARETLLSPAACIQMLRKSPKEPTSDEVARRIAGAPPAGGGLA